MEKDEIRIIILALSLVISNGLTIFLYLKNRKNEIKNDIKEKLFKLQDVVINNPYLEDEKFISGWVEFRKKYHMENLINYESSINLKYLQYEQYCEMIFNFASEVYDETKCEEKLLSQIDFKSWCRTHKTWWSNPLVEYSNHDTYDQDFTKMIDNWLK